MLDCGDVYKEHTVFEVREYVVKIRGLCGKGEIVVDVFTSFMALLVLSWRVN